MVHSAHGTRISLISSLRRYQCLSRKEKYKQNYEKRKILVRYTIVWNDNPQIKRPIKSDTVAHTYSKCSRKKSLEWLFEVRFLM